MLKMQSVSCFDQASYIVKVYLHKTGCPTWYNRFSTGLWVHIYLYYDSSLAMILNVSFQILRADPPV